MVRKPYTQVLRGGVGTNWFLVVNWGGKEPAAEFQLETMRCLLVLAWVLPCLQVSGLWNPGNNNMVSPLRKWFHDLCLCHTLPLPAWSGPPLTPTSSHDGLHLAPSTPGAVLPHTKLFLPQVLMRPAQTSHLLSHTTSSWRLFRITPLKYPLPYHLLSYSSALFPL